MSGPWEDYGGTNTAAPQPVSPTASQGPWSDYADPSAPAPAAPKLDLPTVNRQLRHLFHTGATTADIVAFGKANGVMPNADQIDQARKKGMDVNFVQPDPAANDPSLGDYAKGALEHAGHGLVSGLAFIDDAINPLGAIKDMGDDIKGIYHGLTGGPTAEDRTRAGPGFFQRGIDTVYNKAVPGVTAPAKNALQRYTNNVAEFTGGAAIPMGEFNGVRGIAGLTAAAVGGGVANQAAKDVFPDNPLVQDLAALTGAHVGGTPFALGPLKDNVYVSKAAEHPEAAYVPGAATALADKATDVAPNGLTPKGRGKLTVPQINKVATRYLIGMPEDLNRLVQSGQLDAQAARTLKLAVQNKDGITAPEIDALRGSPEGDAVAEALMHYRATQNLTKPYGGDARGAMAKLWNYTVPKALPKLIGDALTIKPGDANAARIRGADKAIDRVPVYQRLAAKVGPSPVGPAMDTFQQRVADSFADKPSDTPAGPKLSALDQATNEQIDAGVQGDHTATQAIADRLKVKPEDVLRAANGLSVHPALQFELKKLVNGYNTSRTVRPVLNPLIRNALESDGTIAARANEAKASPKATAAGTAAPDAPQATAPSPSEAGDYRQVQRPVAHAEGKSRYQDAFDNQRAKVASSPDFKEMSAIASDGLDHIKNGEKTTESAMRYFDTHVGPKLREHFQPDEIDAFRQEVENMATVGKPYRTDADLEKYAKK